MIVILNHLSAPASVICLYLSLPPVGKLTTETNRRAWHFLLIQKQRCDFSRADVSSYYNNQLYSS